jgi:hypothetical protein
MVSMVFAISGRAVVVGNAVVHADDRAIGDGIDALAVCGVVGVVGADAALAEQAALGIDLAEVQRVPLRQVVLAAEVHERRAMAAARRRAHERDPARATQRRREQQRLARVDRERNFELPRPRRRCPHVGGTARCRRERRRLVRAGRRRRPIGRAGRAHP